jgi:hypothetical protein
MFPECSLEVALPVAMAVIQGTFGVIRGTFGVIQGTFDVIQMMMVISPLGQLGLWAPFSGV